MKKKWLVILAFVTVLCALPLFHSRSAERADRGRDATFVLPLSLVSVEDEAFEGTAVKTVVFPDGLISIGSGTFEQANALTDVFIPNTTEEIADTAFYITPGLTIHGLDKSYAKDWADQHEVPFVVEDVWSVTAPGGRPQNTHTVPLVRTLYAGVLILLLKISRLCYFEVRSRRPQDRPELYPINYRFP